MRPQAVVPVLAAALLVYAADADVPDAGATASGTSRVSVYFPQGGVSADCSRVRPVARTVGAPAVLTGALRSLLRGPTAAERARGYGGWFSARTADALRSVRIRRGVAYVDFADFSRTIPNASSSCGSALLLAQLDRTAKQFPTVRRTVYSFSGSPRAFYEWLQRPSP